MKKSRYSEEQIIGFLEQVAPSCGKPPRMFLSKTTSQKKEVSRALSVVCAPGNIGEISFAPAHISRTPSTDSMQADSAQVLEEGWQMNVLDCANTGSEYREYRVERIPGQCNNTGSEYRVSNNTRSV